MNHRVRYCWLAVVLTGNVAIPGCGADQGQDQLSPVAERDSAETRDTARVSPTHSTTARSDQEATADGDTVARKHTNELVNETSPYLLQHAHNPVNWHPWGPEALAKAKRENKPIFLSVGYSTCYWCHVMERESFENEAVAKVLNEHFVPVKVDREERPDVDEQYMLATQLMTGRGGWPNSVWLTPDGRPWMAGTYFPPEQFAKLLDRLVVLWENDRDRVETLADELVVAMRQASQAPPQGPERKASAQLIARAIEALREDYDQEFAGFGNDQKFPPHAALRLLIDEYRRNPQPELLRMTTATLDAMAAGGIRDHLGGGFHRYATDRQWFLPHFEKMLYDNAQLMRLYADGYVLTGNEAYREVVADIFAWLERRMVDPVGGFYSALDAESDGEEGRYYVWKYDEILSQLGDKPGEQFANIYGCKPHGNWEVEATGHHADTNVAYLPLSLAEVASEQGVERSELHERLERQRQNLLKVRNLRSLPHLDDKILASWNGLMISALAHSGHALDQPEYTAAAERAAQFLLENMITDDSRLLRTYRQGAVRLPGYLDDYAFVADGFLELYEATGDEKWLNESCKLADVIQIDFEDEKDHAFFYTSAAHDDLLLRSKNLLGGGNLPSANAVAIEVLSRLSEATGEAKYGDSAEAAIEALSERMWQAPRGAEDLVAAAGNLLARASDAPDTQRPADQAE